MRSVPTAYVLYCWQNMQACDCDCGVHIIIILWLLLYYTPCLKKTRTATINNT